MDGKEGGRILVEKLRGGNSEYKKTDARIRRMLSPGAAARLYFYSPAVMRSG